MKRLTLFVCLLLLCASQYAMAQDDVYESGKPKHDMRPANGTREKSPRHKGVDPKFCRKLYIGFSLGVNNPAGIVGLDVDVPVSKKISVGVGIGSSTWGTKVYVDGKYYFKPCHRGFALGLGITHNMGNSNFNENLETIYGTEPVTLNLNPQTNIFIGAYYYWTLGRRYNRFFLDAGYSVPFSMYSYTEKMGDPLDNTGEAVVKILSPGGLMMGVGFSFGAIH